MHQRGRTARHLVAALGLILIVTALPATAPVASTPAAAETRAHSVAVPPQPPETLTHEIEKLLDACPGEPSIVIRLLDEDWSIAHNQDRVVKAASVIKLPILVAVLRIVERDGLDLSEKIAILAQDRTGGSGRLKSIRRNRPRTLHQLLRLMIVESDNTATNALVRRFGREAIDGEFEAMGLIETRLHHLILRSNEDNPTTARETANLIERIVRDDDERLIDNPEHRTLALFLMGEVLNHRRLGRFLPAESRLRHKTGTLHSVIHDVGLFETGRGKVLVAALVSGANDHAAAEEWIARLGQAVHDGLQGGGD